MLFQDPVRQDIYDLLKQRALGRKLSCIQDELAHRHLPELVFDTVIDMSEDGIIWYHPLTGTYQLCARSL
jgi:hypothetical protein